MRQTNKQINKEASKNQLQPNQPTTTKPKTRTNKQHKKLSVLKRLLSGIQSFSHPLTFNFPGQWAKL